MEKLFFKYSECNYFLSEILPNAQPKKIRSTMNISDKEEDEVALYKRHRKYFQDAERVTSAVWCRKREYKSVDVIRDMNFFYVKIFNKWPSCLHMLWMWIIFAMAKIPMSLDCFELDFCGGCYLSGKRPKGHLNIHKTIKLR